MAKEKVKKTKNSKSVASEGVAHILATFNNTIINITDKKKVIRSLGQVQAQMDLRAQEKALLSLPKSLQQKLENKLRI